MPQQHVWSEDCSIPPYLLSYLCPLTLSDRGQCISVVFHADPRRASPVAYLVTHGFAQSVYSTIHRRQSGSLFYGMSRRDAEHGEMAAEQDTPHSPPHTIPTNSTQVRVPFGCRGWRKFGHSLLSFSFSSTPLALAIPPFSAVINL